MTTAIEESTPSSDVKSHQVYKKQKLENECGTSVVQTHTSDAVPVTTDNNLEQGTDATDSDSDPTQKPKIPEKKETSCKTGFSAFSEAKSGFASFQSTSDSSFSRFSAQAKSQDDGFLHCANMSSEGTASAPSLTEVELANGEENEVILDEQRGKLFRLAESDYVEVGIGPIRLLTSLNQNVSTANRDTTRLVMRRESYPRGPGTKVILNARLRACVSNVPKPDRTLVFTLLEPRLDTEETQSQSEDQLKKVNSITYALRFSSPESFSTFHQTLERVLSNQI